MEKIVVLFSRSYPYGKGESFIDAELEVLAQHFEQILVLPRIKEGRRRELPPNVMVDECLAADLAGFLAKLLMVIRSTLICLFSAWFWREISVLLRRNPSFFWLALRKTLLAGRVGVKRYLLVKAHFAQLFEGQSNIIFYSYWFNESAVAAVLLKKHFAGLAITRAHGQDLYEERHQPPFLPLKKSMGKALDGVFPISAHGAKYLKQRYGISDDKIHLARLGIPGESRAQVQSTVPQDKFHVLSCSFISRVKRVHLIPLALKQLAMKYPKQSIAWTHIGDGDAALTKELLALIDQLPDNVSVDLKGFLPQREIFKCYASSPASVFINVSQSEGLPVSIMEAQSFGIPVIATRVGGTPEIVNNTNGFLLSVDPEIGELVGAFEAFMAEDIRREKGKVSYQNWEKNFNAAINFDHFYQKIVELLP